MKLFHIHKWENISMSFDRLRGRVLLKRCERCGKVVEIRRKRWKKN